MHEINVTILMTPFALVVGMEFITRIPRRLVRLMGLVVVVFALASWFWKIRVPISQDVDFLLTIFSAALMIVAGLFLAPRPAEAGKPRGQPVSNDLGDREAAG